ncbi:hypothetical protein [Anthocerotibacter panamensis]|uniref:hypothetical protein n=1 Tax=Anthocerotibacter panamensis TaxID=2857077 RepID=UPI001C407BDE|nr:hypothetical protein [Anthocerotibacter panamensis]
MSWKVRVSDYLQTTRPAVEWVEQAIRRLQLPPKEQRTEGDYERLHAALVNPPRFWPGDRVRYIGTNPHYRAHYAGHVLIFHGTCPGGYGCARLPQEHPLGQTLTTWIPLADFAHLEEP